MLTFLVLGILIGALAVVFALQNIAVVTVSFFAWQLTGSLAVILILAILSGMLVMSLLVLPSSISNSFKYRRLAKEIKKLEEDLRKQKELTLFAKNSEPSQEDIARIEHGATENPSVL